MQKNISNSKWNLDQLLGYRNPSDKIQPEDIISAIKHDKTGKLVALGDNAGRIIAFQTPQKKKKSNQTYEYSFQFQSHQRQFDPLESKEVNEAIKNICWLAPQGKFMKMVTTNIKRIKLWRISQKLQKKVAKSAGKELNIPKVQIIQSSFVSNAYKIFPSQHEGDINDISVSKNEEYLLSSDQIQIFLWNMEKPQKPFMVTNLKHNLNLKTEELKQKITCSKFHPFSDSLFLYGTNKGTLKVGDLRISASCDNGITFKTQAPVNKNFFTEMTSNLSGAQFLQDGKHIITRDYLTVKIWDIASNKAPITTITVQDSLKGRLSQMFENDSIYDKFFIAGSNNSTTILTGNYNNCFHLMDTKNYTNTQYELSYKKQTICKQIIPNKMIPISKMDYLRKTAVGSFNPIKNQIAVSSLNCFFIYSL